METPAHRQRLVDGMLAMTEGTALAAGPLERWLLARYVAGALTIDQVCEQLAERAARADGGPETAAAA